MGSLEIQIFVSLFVILGAAFVALLCDFLKGNNERLRERNIELQTRHEERDKRELLLEQAQRQAWNVAVQAQETAAVQLAAQAEERASEEAEPEAAAPPLPPVLPAPDLARAPNPQDDLKSRPQPILASGGPILPVPASPAMPVAAIPASAAHGLDQGGPRYPDPLPLEINVIAETPLPELPHAVAPGSGLQPKSHWSIQEQLLGGEEQSPQPLQAAGSSPAWDGKSAKLPSFLPQWVPQPLRELLVRSLPMAGRIPIDLGPVHAAPFGRYWTLVARWPIGRRQMPSSVSPQLRGLGWAGQVALPAQTIQAAATPLFREIVPASMTPAVTTLLPALGVGVTVGLRSGHLKPISLPALALRASLAQLPLELPIPAKPAVGRPPASDLSVESELPDVAVANAVEAGPVKVTLRPASIAPLLADTSEAELPRVESRFPRFPGEFERTLPRHGGPVSIPGLTPCAPTVAGTPAEVAPLFEAPDRTAGFPWLSRSLAAALPGAELEEVKLPGVACAPVSFQPIPCGGFAITGCAAIPASGLQVQPPAVIREAPGLKLSTPLPSQPQASSFYPFAPLSERLTDPASPALPEQRLELDEIGSSEPATPQEADEPIVRIRVLQEEDLRPLGNLTPLAPGAPMFFSSTQRGLEFREESPVVEEAPLEIEAGCTIEGGFAHDPVALQPPPKQPSRVVVMPAFDDLRAMFAPSAPSLQHRLDVPGNLLHMPAAPPSEPLPAGLQTSEILEMALRRSGPFSGAVMMVTIADFEKAVQQHGESAVGQVLGDVQSFVTEAAGAGAFLSRTPGQELVFAWPHERVPDPQPVFHAITEKLWDYQLRTLGGVAVIFSWGFHESRGDTFSRALGAAREQMMENRRPRQTTMTGVGRFRRLMVG